MEFQPGGMGAGKKYLERIICEGIAVSADRIGGRRIKAVAVGANLHENRVVAPGGDSGAKFLHGRSKFVAWALSGFVAPYVCYIELGYPYSVQGYVLRYHAGISALLRYRRNLVFPARSGHAGAKQQRQEQHGGNSSHSHITRKRL